MKRKTFQNLVGAITSVVVLVVLAALLVGMNTFGRNVSFTVVCDSGQPVVGIYAAAQDDFLGISSSGWVENWRARVDFPSIADATYWAKFGRPIEFRFGCGGSGADWDVINDPGYSSADAMVITCDDANLLPGSHNTDCKTEVAHS